MYVGRLILFAWLCMFFEMQGVSQNVLTLSAIDVGTASPGPVITNIISCLSRIKSETNLETPVKLEATITYVDPERSLIVLQDDSAAMSVYMPSNDTAMKAGQRILLEGRGVYPCFRAFPSYPDQPSQARCLSSFETTNGMGWHYLARFRGWLHPPVTGMYTFWIASDDAGELCLGPDASPKNKRRIAFNGFGNSTRPHEWDRFPSQKSEPVLLEAGKSYYIEALHVQNYGSDSLAVAWEGPDIQRSVIDGRFLTPWIDSHPEGARTIASLLQTNGILRECWTNFYVGDFELLHAQSPDENLAQFHSLKSTILGDGQMPAPVKISPEMNLDDVSDLSWVEVEGEVNFAAGSQSRGQLELKRGDSILKASVLNWNGLPIERLIHSRVRVRGVLVHAYNSEGSQTDHMIWTPDRQQISLLPVAKNQPENLDHTSLCDITPSNPMMNWGRQVLVHGRIINQTTNGLLLLQGDDNYQGFYSIDGTNWVSLGVPVEISMSNSVLVGLAMASQTSKNQTSVTFGGLQGWGTNWFVEDIGSPQPTGQFNVHDGILTMRGEGAGIGSNRDQQYYVYQRLGDRTEVTAQLTSLQQVASHTQVGIMIRDSVNRRAPYAAVLFTPIGGTAFQFRSTFGDYSMAVPAGPVYRKYCWMKLVKQKSLLLIDAKLDPMIQTDQEVEVSGIVTWQNDTPILTEASFLPIGQHISSPQLTIDESQSAISIADFVTKAEHPPQTFLSRNMRAKNLRGVVTFVGDVLGGKYLFIQGGDGGAIRVNWPDTNQVPDLAVGQLLEMTGQSSVRQFPVIFGISKYTILGWGNLPDPAPYTSTFLASDNIQARWVEAAGVVHSIETNGLLNLMTGEGNLPVWVANLPAADRANYIDTAVRIRGVLSLDATRSVRLLAPSSDEVEVLESSPKDPFAIPRSTISELAGLSIKPDQMRRKKLSGVVTCALSQGIYVQDESGGAYVPTLHTNMYHPGDKIEAVGYPESDVNGFALGEAKIRTLGVAELPKPFEMGSLQIDKKMHASELVCLRATLLDRHMGWGGQVLVLQVGTKILEAMLPNETPRQLDDLPVGCGVFVTGVCQMGVENAPKYPPMAGEDLSSVALKLWLRSPADVIVLERPTWWTMKRVAWFGVLLLSGLMAALIWIPILRRRVVVRTRELQAAMSQLEEETRASAQLAERDRLAGEIHDSLEQGLTAIMLQLDVAEKHVEKSPEARTILRRARNMAEFSRAEIQHAVWDMLSPLLTDADLATAIRHVAEQISSNSPRVIIEVKGISRPLPSSYDHHLLRMVQESITNAVKHAEARSILVTLDYNGGTFKLTIADDGKGFDPGTVNPLGQNGHYGLQGMRARAKKLEARFDLASRPGQGTIISIQINPNTDGPGAAHAN